MSLRYRYAAIRLLLAMKPGRTYVRDERWACGGVDLCAAGFTPLRPDPCRTTLGTINALEARGLVTWDATPEGTAFYRLTPTGELERERLARELPVR